MTDVVLNKQYFCPHMDSVGHISCIKWEHKSDEGIWGRDCLDRPYLAPTRNEKESTYFKSNSSYPKKRRS